jgi:cyclopropane fatty-acyl-phospholipid synthase-like methyltransferase
MESMLPLPFSEACERNKGPILEALRTAFAPCRAILEIGAGTGQHAVHFASHLTHLAWQPTDRTEYLAGLAARIAQEGPENLRPPLEFDVTRPPSLPGAFDAMFSANTLHIMSWAEVQAFFACADRALGPGGVLAVYGPFRYRGAFTTESNAHFDRALRERDPASGLRDFEAVDALASARGFVLVADHSMPANNQLLVWTQNP